MWSDVAGKGCIEGSTLATDGWSEISRKTAQLPVLVNTDSFISEILFSTIVGVNLQGTDNEKI